MGVFIFESDKDLVKPRHAVTMQDLHKMFESALAPDEVKEITIDFKNGVIKGKYKSEKSWKTKTIKFIEV